MKLSLFLSCIPLLLFVVSYDDSDIVSENNGNEDPTDEPDEELEWQLVWSNEFDGKELDTDKWSYQYGTGESEGLTVFGLCCRTTHFEVRLQN